MTDILEIIKKFQEMYGDDVITTADKINRPEPKKEIQEIEAINEFMKRNPQADGGRIGFKKKGFVSGTGTGVKGIDDPKKYKIVKKYLNKVKSQKNKRIFLDWSEQIGGKKTKWYTDLSKEVKLSRDPLNKLINKVTLEEFPTAYAGKTGRVNYAREMVVKSFIDYWNQNGAFDGNEKLSKILNQFEKDSVDKRFENINRYFMDWKEGKFEVPGVDRKNLDKNLLKDIKNYKPNAKDKRSLLVAKQLIYLDGLSPKYSFDTVEKLFAKQYPDNAQTLQHRLNQLTQLKRNGAYNTGAGNVAKIAIIKKGDRPKWLIEGYGKGFTGNYGNLIKKADDLLAAGDKVSAKRLYKAADKFFSPNGIFTKAAGEGEHPLSRNMGDGPIGNQLKINSLVSGDLNQFKKFNFDSPVRNAVLEYNNPKTTDARRAELKIEIENRKKLMNILTEGPNQKGIVESVKFNYGPKELTASVDVIDIDKVKNFDINEYIARGDDYRKSFVAKGEKLGLIDESGNIIKQTFKPKQQMELLKKMGYRCLKAAGGGETLECYIKDVEETKAQARKGNPTAIKRQKKAFDVAKQLPKIGKFVRQGVQAGAAGLATAFKWTGLGAPIGYAIEGAIEGGIYDYYRGQGYSHDQAFAETFSPRLAKEALEGKSTEDVPWYGGAEELIEQEKIGTRWDPSGKVNLAAKYADAKSKYDEAVEKYYEIQGSTKPTTLEQAEAQQAALAEQEAIIRALEPSIKAGTPEYEAYQQAEERQAGLMDERARDYKSKNRFLGLEWDLSPEQIKQRTPSASKERQILKQREREMDEWKGGRDAFTIKPGEYIDWAAYGMADEEGIKEKWRQLYEAGGMDLLDRIAIGGGVSNLAEGGIASLKKKW